MKRNNAGIYGLNRRGGPPNPTVPRLPTVTDPAAAAVLRPFARPRGRYLFNAVFDLLERRETNKERPREIGHETHDQNLPPLRRRPEAAQ